MTIIAILIILAPIVGIIAIIMRGIVAWLSGSVVRSIVSAPAGCLLDSGQSSVVGFILGWGAYRRRPSSLHQCFSLSLCTNVLSLSPPHLPSL